MNAQRNRAHPHVIEHTPIYNLRDYTCRIHSQRRRQMLKDALCYLAGIMLVIMMLWGAQ